MLRPTFGLMLCIAILKFLIILSLNLFVKWSLMEQWSMHLSRTTPKKEKTLYFSSFSSTLPSFLKKKPHIFILRRPWKWHSPSWLDWRLFARLPFWNLMDKLGLSSDLKTRGEPRIMVGSQKHSCRSGGKEKPLSVQMDWVIRAASSDLNSIQLTGWRPHSSLQSESCWMPDELSILG